MTLPRFAFARLAVVAAAAALAACSGGDAPAGPDAGEGGGNGGQPDGGGGSAGAAGEGGTGGTGGASEDPRYPELLSEAGLFSDVPNETLAEGVRFYEPRYALWSDGTDKRRWLYLPEGTEIDTRDMDHWEFPVGTKVFKEFSLDGLRIETRMLHKIAADDWVMIAYLWNDDLTEAEAVRWGEKNAKGTSHEVPNFQDCGSCHDRMDDILISVSAIAMSHDGEGVTLQGLVDEGRLSDPPAAPIAVPGDEAASESLGYLHVNCGFCHRPGSDVSEKVNLDLWLTVSSLGSVEDTPAYRTTVGVEAQISDQALEGGVRIVPGDPDASLLVERMSIRGDVGAMPPLATNEVDEDALANLRLWIESLEAAPGE